MKNHQELWDKALGINPILKNERIFKKDKEDDNYWIFKIKDTDVCYNAAREIWFIGNTSYLYGVRIDLEYVIERVLEKLGPDNDVYINILFNLDELGKL